MFSRSVVSFSVDTVPSPCLFLSYLAFCSLTQVSEILYRKEVIEWRENVMHDKRTAAPDSTAVRVVLWRAIHVQVDPPRRLFQRRSQMSGGGEVLEADADLNLRRPA
jgi:hypothetical protein